MLLMFMLVLIMPKRLKYVLASVVASCLLLVVLLLPYEAKYSFLFGCFLILIPVIWFGLNAWKESWFIKGVILLMPLLFFSGFGLFTMLLPFSIELSIVLAAFLGAVWYIIFLTENIFLVAAGFKTVPLYRAAWTVTLLLSQLCAFFLFDSILSYRLAFWLNAGLVLVVSLMLFSYLYWVVFIDVAKKDDDSFFYILIPALLMGELSLVFSFWPVGIFIGSIYLVIAFYLLTGLMHAEIRERLFRKTWLEFIWTGIAAAVAAVLMTSWR